MSYTNGTPFLNLPQTIGSDHRDWFDTNEAFLNMDGKFKTLWDDSGSAASAIAALQELTATLQTDLTSLEGTVDTHTSALSTINEALVLINGTLATLNTSVATKFDSAGIADPYDAAHGIYEVDDVVTYNGQRYVCSTAVTAAEPFDADKWTAEDVQSVLGPIKNSVSIFDNFVDEREYQIFSISADGVKTDGQLLNELYALVQSTVNALPPARKRTLRIDCPYGSFSCNAIGSNTLEFYGVESIPDTMERMDIIAIKLQLTGSNVFRVRTDFTQSPSVTTIDSRTNEVRSLGGFTLYIL